MPGKEGLEEEIAKNVAAPLIKRLLKPFSSKDMSEAIAKNVDLAKALMEDPEYLRHIRSLVSVFPFADKAGPKIRSKRWVRWFLSNELAHSRPDLYAQIVYTPGGFEYVLRQVRKLTKLVFEGLDDRGTRS